MTNADLPWIVRTADATSLGLTRATLGGPSFERVRRGAWTAVTDGRIDGDVRIAAVAAELPPHAVLAGWAAARLHELAFAGDAQDVFDGARAWEELQTSTGRRTFADAGRVPGARVVVASGCETRLRFRPDVRVLRSVVPADERCAVGGAGATTPVRTALDLARLLPTRAAVIGVDRLLQLGLVTIPAFSRLVEARAGWVGIGRARAVAELVAVGVESPQESVLRLIWHAARLPRPLCNAVVRDRAGRFVGRVDIIDPEVGLVAEYDGHWHSGSERRGADARRQQALEALGLVVVRATADDVRPERETATAMRLREARRRAAQITRRAWTITPD